jgi:hypothetical protein
VGQGGGKKMIVDLDTDEIRLIFFAAGFCMRDLCETDQEILGSLLMKLNPPKVAG